MNNPNNPPQLEIKSGNVDDSDRFIAMKLFSLNDIKTLLVDSPLIRHKKDYFYINCFSIAFLMISE